MKFQNFMYTFLFGVFLTLIMPIQASQQSIMEEGSKQEDIVKYLTSKGFPFSRVTKVISKLPAKETYSAYFGEGQYIVECRVFFNQENTISTIACSLEESIGIPGLYREMPVSPDLSKAWYEQIKSK